jgi:S-adenosylmethionine-diacylgycerolhomoserine-N-methlytransferase
LRTGLLSPSLLRIARERIADRGWNYVEAVEADVTTWTPPEGELDALTFSYSLTMIPDWFAAVDRAYELLKPGGVIGVVDFFVARKYAEGRFGKHNWFTRTFWPTWFATDNVQVTPDLVPYLHHKFECAQYSEHRGKVPYMPVKVPYFRFIGKKTV